MNRRPSGCFAPFGKVMVRTTVLVVVLICEMEFESALVTKTWRPLGVTATTCGRLKGSSKRCWGVGKRETGNGGIVLPIAAVHADEGQQYQRK